jgi:hypothetical protein
VRKSDQGAGRQPGGYLKGGGFNVDLETHQRNAIIVGALAGLVLGAGAGFLLSQPVPEEQREGKPVRPLDVLQIVRNAAGLLRELDEMRYRL